jgi:hypothetical protein
MSAAFIEHFPRDSNDTRMASSCTFEVIPLLGGSKDLMIFRPLEKHQLVLALVNVGHLHDKLK